MKISIKKYQLILLAACLFFNAAKAQYNLNLILNSKMPSYLSDWTSSAAGQLIITYTGPLPSVKVKLATQLQSANGSAIGISNTVTAQIFTITTGANIIRLDRVLQLENMVFPGNANSLARSGKLSAGSYQLCVQLLTIDGIVLANQQCRPFFQVNYQLPYLLTPNDKTWLDANVAQTAITFRWSSLVPVSQELVTYRLQVYEILSSQTPMQALRTNQPILITDVKRTTQYIWQPHLFFKDSSLHIFIWTVQTLDSKGVPITSPDVYNQGRSEPRVFGICNKKRSEGVVPDCGNDYKW